MMCEKNDTGKIVWFEVGAGSIIGRGLRVLRFGGFETDAYLPNFLFLSLLSAENFLCQFYLHVLTLTPLYTPHVY